MFSPLDDDERSQLKYSETQPPRSEPAPASLESGVCNTRSFGSKGTTHVCTGQRWIAVVAVVCEILNLFSRRPEPSTTSTSRVPERELMTRS